MLLLLAGVVAASGADLAVTIWHLRTHGLFEANPVAAYLIAATRSVLVLSAFKAASVGVCVAVLFCLRARRSAEAAAWCAIGILAVMSWYWYAYAQELRSLDVAALARAGPDAGMLVLE